MVMVKGRDTVKAKELEGEVTGGVAAVAAAAVLGTGQAVSVLVMVLAMGRVTVRVEGWEAAVMGVAEEAGKAVGPGTGSEGADRDTVRDTAVVPGTKVVVA